MPTINHNTQALQQEVPKMPEIETSEVMHYVDS